MIYLVGLPYDNTSRIKGSSRAPEAIRKRLEDTYSFDPESEADFWDYLIDLGNLKPEDLGKLDPTKRYVFLGGEHTVTYWIAKSLKRTRILILDAHLDCMEGSLGYMTFVRFLINEEFSVRVFGARAYTKEERDFARKYGIILKDLDELEWERFHLSIDMDFFHPLVGLGTGSPEVGGPFFEEFLPTLKNLLKKAESIDIVEVNPERGFSSVLYAAEIVKLAAIIAGRG